ncbi:MAG: WecB/TagA/CpsF family glycosyltransferase [Candidatus Eisenbacteria bacterium]|nr:WecB/TagA/CpsF family glycosyltransferase [Candidatus Eisenbacteria bacterium]
MTVKMAGELWVPVAFATGDELLTQALHSVSAGQRETLVFANAHLLNLVYPREDIRGWLRGTRIIADGKGVKLGLLCITGQRVDQVRFLDWIHDFLELAGRMNWGLFVVGGSSSVLGDAITAVRRLHPTVSLVGTHHGYFGMGAELSSLVSEINRARPTVVLTCCGMLKDEEWLMQCRDQLDVPIVIAAAGALDFLAGRLLEAPPFIRTLWLEWLFRMVLEPRRLAPRYAIGIPQYVMRLLRWKLRSSASRRLPREGQSIR